MGVPRCIKNYFRGSFVEEWWGNTAVGVGGRPLRERVPGTHSTGGWVTYPVGVGALENNKTSCPCWDRSFDRAVSLQ